MKITAIISYVFFLTPLIVSASGRDGRENCEKRAGIFESSDSYVKHDITHTVCLSENQNSVKVNLSYNVIIRDKEAKFTYNRKSIYGYSNGEAAFRYFETKGIFDPYGYFQFQDTSGIIIYSQRNWAGFFGQARTFYFYSLSLNSPIKRLIISNLKRDFPNDGFIEAVKQLKYLNEKTQSNKYAINLLYAKYFNR